MQTVTTIGLDIAKSVFQVYGVHRKSDVRDPNFRARARMSGDRLRVIIYLRAVALALAT